MATQSIVGEKSLAFGKRIAKCYRSLKDKKKETVMSKQLLRCGTSIGANVREDNDELLRLLTSIIKTTKEQS